MAFVIICKVSEVQDRMRENNTRRLFAVHAHQAPDPVEEEARLQRGQEYLDKNPGCIILNSGQRLYEYRELYYE